MRLVPTTKGRTLAIIVKKVASGRQEVARSKKDTPGKVETKSIDPGLVSSSNV